MANLMPLLHKIDEFKAELSELIRLYSNELREEIAQEILKEKKEKENRELKEFERIQLSKANAPRFLKILQVIEEIEDKGNLGEGKVSTIAEKHGISHEEARIILKMVRYARLYQKFVGAKSEIYRFL